MGSGCCTSRSCCRSPAIAADHGGIKRDLVRPRSWLAGRSCGGRPTSASTSTGRTGRSDPGELPRLRWVQGTSAGIGGLLRAHRADRRRDLSSPPPPACTECRSPSSRCSGCCISPRACPCCTSGRRERHWQRHTTGHWRGSPGGAGRARRRRPPVASLLAAAGIEVTGAAGLAAATTCPGSRHYVNEPRLLEVLPGSRRARSSRAR